MIEESAHGTIGETDSAFGDKDFAYKVQLEGGGVALWLKSDVLIQRHPQLYSQVVPLKNEFIFTLKVGDRVTVRFIEVDGMKVILSLEPHILEPVPQIEWAKGIILEIDDREPAFGGKDYEFKVQLEDGSLAYKIKSDVFLDAHRHLEKYSQPLTVKFIRNCKTGDSVKISYAQSKGVAVILSMQGA